VEIVNAESTTIAAEKPPLIFRGAKVKKKCGYSKNIFKK